MSRMLCIALLTLTLIFVSGCKEERLEANVVETEWCFDCGKQIQSNDSCIHLMHKFKWR